jgi:vacuolar-type H+-ATPase subunit D/Vma8
MELNETLRRIIDDNREARREMQGKLARLSDVIQTGTIDEYREAVKELTGDDERPTAPDDPGES